MKKYAKAEAIIYIVIGSLSLILSLICFASDTGTFESLSSYGGDAYTGIQNAGALTANNVRCVARICAFGFGSILLLAGALILSKGVLLLVEGLKKIQVSPTAPRSETCVEVNDSEQVGVPTPSASVTTSVSSTLRSGE